MNIKNKYNKDFELIEKFNSGEMMGTELSEFLKRIQDDPELAAEVELSKEIDDFLVKDKERIELWEQLDSIYYKLKAEGKLSTRENQKKKSRPIFHIKWYHAAASIVILIGVSAVLYFTFRPSLNERLYSEYFKSYEYTTTVRSGNQDHQKNQMQSALDEYNDEDFKTAWTMFKDISDKNKKNAKAYFFRGMSAMEINELDDAIASFNNVIKHETSLYIDQAIWYQALCYLKKDDSANALKQLSKVVESNGNHKDEAEVIIEKLKNK
jgi:tetratricopeptide (TPR) repeat protein